ncbi:hypothetical protein GCK32_019260 [Trichostrongylus colubriformis]|uniref:Uncharacterized protein n=1 Tax=Trichostrongylus colubriformis TaxID=6319 RepID=A0AAN8FTJ9_TRICO
MKEPITTLGRPPTTITKTTTTTTTTVPTTSITLTSTDAVPAPISIPMEIMRGADLTVPENVEQSDHLPDLSLIHPVRKKHIGSEIGDPFLRNLLPNGLS